MIRFLHTRIRVQDLDASIGFYKKLGYQEKERKSSPQGNQLAFMELPGNDVFLELTWSDDYDTICPEDLMHTALGVDDIIDYCDGLEKAGIEIWPATARWRLSPIPTVTRSKSSKGEAKPVSISPRSPRMAKNLCHWWILQWQRHGILP